MLIHLIHHTIETVSQTVCVLTLDILTNVEKTRKWLGSNSNSHVTFFDKNLVFKSKLLQCGISTVSRNLSVQKACTNGHTFKFQFHRAF
jgi:hypothetical protein